MIQLSRRDRQTERKKEILTIFLVHCLSDWVLSLVMRMIQCFSDDGNQIEAAIEERRKKDVTMMRMIAS